MTANESLHLSLQIKDLLKPDLLPVFNDDVPVGLIENQALQLIPDSRERVFTPCNVLLNNK